MNFPAIERVLLVVSDARKKNRAEQKPVSIYGFLVFDYAHNRKEFRGMRINLQRLSINFLYLAIDDCRAVSFQHLETEANLVPARPGDGDRWPLGVHPCRLKRPAGWLAAPF